MAAVVRLKRLIEDEPSEALVINCKRRKTEESEPLDQPLPTVLKFACTVEDQNVDIFKHIKKPTKAEVEGEFKKHSVDIISKLRQKNQLASRESRYKVINCYRTNETKSETVDAEATNLSNSFTVFDIELKESNDNIKQETSKEPHYVYDLYYTQSDYLGDAEINELVSIYPLSDELAYSCYRDSGLNDTDSCDSEDSNAENNWKNDYPDEESDLESITEEDMIRAVNRMDVNKESDLSSDDAEDKYIYDDEESDINEEDVRKYGRLYAKFKAKSQRLMEPKNKDHNFYFGDEDDYYE